MAFILSTFHRFPRKKVAQVSSGFYARTYFWMPMRVDNPRTYISAIVFVSVNGSLLGWLWIIIDLPLLSPIHVFLDKEKVTCALLLCHGFP